MRVDPASCTESALRCGEDVLMNDDEEVVGVVYLLILHSFLRICVENEDWVCDSNPVFFPFFAILHRPFLF